MSDDPTGWFRPRGSDRREPTGDEPTPTERLDAPDDPPPTEPLGDGDGLSNLFGDQRDYSSESDWLPPRDPDVRAPGVRDPGNEVPTAVQPVAGASDPLDWLDDGSIDDATTVAYGPRSAAGGLGAGAVGAAGVAGAAGATGDAVTQRYDAAAYPPPSETSTGGLPPEDGGSRRLVIALAIIGGVLVIALVIALVWLFGSSGSADPTPAPTEAGPTSRAPSPTPSRTRAAPSATPTPTPAPTPTATTPPVAAPTIGSFSASPSVPPCTTATGTVNVSFSWATSNAATVSLSIDGVADPYNDQLSGSGTLSGVPYDCSKASQGYTLIARNSAGEQVAEPLTLTRPTIDDGGGDAGGGDDGGTGGGDGDGTGGGDDGSGDG